MTYKTFDEWMAAVDREIAVSLCGLNSEDLPDANYYDMYESEYTPEDAAAEVLEDAGMDW
jgi:hypothetical protein